MSTTDFLSPWLLSQVQDGNAILFLGAGASYDAITPSGKSVLGAEHLRDLISNEFLGGELKTRSLAEVSEYAKNESSLKDVQRFIYNIYEPLQPAAFHKIVPLFRWHAIVTTNYDYLIERAYTSTENALQKPVRIIKDGDAKKEYLGDAQMVPYLKLHGCLSSITDPDLPLILSTEEYARHRCNRERVFSIFGDWARSHPIIFCGYNIGDPNIQQILFDLGDKSVNRPIYATINPSLTSFDLRYWQSRRIIPLQLTFEDFLSRLNSSIEPQLRMLSVLRTPNASSIQKWIVRGTPSSDLLVYLDQEVEHVREGLPTSAIDARDFYRGKGDSWYPIQICLDVERRFVDELLYEAVLDCPADGRPRIYLVKGHAGSGKTIALRRIAWNAAVNHGALVFWLKAGANFRFDLVREIYNLTNERIYFFLDDAIDNLGLLDSFATASRNESIPLTMIIGARSNEWNVAGGKFDSLIENDYELRKLDNREISDLLKRLEANGCLGHLATLAVSERANHFFLTAERQLLVALHEATSGKSFEDIVLDEYLNVVPIEARSLYLDVCTFHRLNVPLRAGLVSRISGITMDYFRERLFKPLEHIVEVVFDGLSRDYAYRSRHPVIAELVFEQALGDPERRAEQIIRIVCHMNVDFRTDQIAFENLIKGKDLARLFDDRTLVERIFVAARNTSASIAHIEHQWAVFEMHHPSGNLHRALQALQKAEAAKEYGGQAIQHTRATVLRRLACEAASELEKDKLRAEASNVVTKLIRHGGSSHPYHTLSSIKLDILKERVSELNTIEEASIASRQTQIANLVAEIGRILSDGLQRFPGDAYLLDLEAQVASTMEDEPRAVMILERALEANPGDGFISSRLARCFMQRGDRSGAKEVLLRSLEKNPANREIHVRLALLLSDEDPVLNRESIRVHLRSGFSPGDTNYEAQFLYARHEFLYGELAKAKEMFDTLKKAKLSPRDKERTRGKVLQKDGAPVRYRGTVETKSAKHCFVRSNDLAGDVFMHPSAFLEGEWDAVTSISEIEFELAFSLRGPVGEEGQVIRGRSG